MRTSFIPKSVALVHRPAKTPGPESGSKRSWLQKVRFCLSLTTLYGATGLFIWVALQHPGTLNPARYVSVVTASAQPPLPALPSADEISGIPVRIVIPDSAYAGKHVDLPIDKGYYDPASNSWSLSGTRAQFMTISAEANNFAGDTYIYGHNNDSVFGALRHTTPSVGSTALIYTSNGHIFSYHFVGSTNVAPDATEVLNYQGAPIMTIQTCTGSFNEVRTLYRYAFYEVVQ